MKIVMSAKELVTAVKGINKVFSGSSVPKVSKWVVSNEGLIIQAFSSNQTLESFLGYTSTDGEEGVFYVPEFKLPSNLTSKKGAIYIEFLPTEIIFRYNGEPEYSIPVINTDVNDIEKYFEIVDKYNREEYNDSYTIGLNPKLLLNLLEPLKDEKAVKLVLNPNNTIAPIRLFNLRETEKRLLMPIKL